ncbi:unnamed protein product [Merluccius merluccius]
MRITIRSPRSKTTRDGKTIRSRTPRSGPCDLFGLRDNVMLPGRMSGGGEDYLIECDILICSPGAHARARAGAVGEAARMLGAARDSAHGPDTSVIV